MNTLMIILVLWTIAGMLAFMVVRVDVDTMKEHPLGSSLILLYFGPVGWLVCMVRLFQIWVHHPND